MTNHRFLSSIRLMLSVFLLSLLISGAALAQSGTATVRGTVKDQQGNAVGGATVTLINTETNASRTQTTNEIGSYTFSSVAPGAYRIEASATGFKKASVTEVRALVDTPTEINVQLEVGNVTEVVTITSQSAEVTLNTQDATIGNTFVERQIKQLPLNARNVANLLSLQPAVTPDGYVAGGRSDQANLTLDGVDVNEQQQGTAFGPVLRVTPDSVQEFRVTTTNANASQGRSSGAQVSLLTKSGTNDFHGTLYWFHRNTATTANDFFNNLAVDENGRHKPIPRPKLIRNLFGGALGGPIVKDRAFFFYNYEGRRDAREATALRTVPLASLGRGEVRYNSTAGGIKTLTTTDINRLFPVGANPAAIAVLNDAARKYPANDFSIGDGLNTGGFRFNAPIRLSENVHTSRFDFNVAERHSVFLRGIFQYDLVGQAPQFPDTPSPNFWNHPIGIAANHAWTVTPTIINNFTYGLTRQAFSELGDSNQNAISFRFVFSPVAFSRTLSRTTPVHNIADDVSWTKDRHNFQFGINFRFIDNNRISFAKSFDSAIANPSFYDQSGAVLSAPITDIQGSRSGVQAAVSAIIGRFSQYSGNFNFGPNGSVLAAGEGVNRTFATEEYEGYFQDTWRFRPNLTFTLGMRYGINTPVYETNGLQVKPNLSLGEFFERRIASAAKGVPLNDTFSVDLAGPANDRPGFYETDKNNWQPRVAIAYSPNFRDGFLHKLFGNEGDSVFRTGFAMTYDRIGSQLAVSFDLNNTLGFSSTQTISANSYNVSDRPAPRFTGFGQQVRTLPGITVPAALKFPLSTPADGAQRIESSLDDTLTTPVNYSWNFSYGREFKRLGMTLDASYVGRAARHLLATRDIMALNNLVDAKTGMDWYTAARILADLRLKNTPITAVPSIPYFQNLFPNYTTVVGGVPLNSTQRIYRLVAREEVGGFNIMDWTFIQLLIDDRGITPNAFFHPQYAALSTFSTVSSSNYHAGTLTLRQRFKQQLFFDFNYTFSKSIDDASGLQTSGSYGSAFILNPLRQADSKAVSDFDLRHIVNANFLWELPFGRGRSFGGGISPVADVIIGGWQLSGIFRWNSGEPVSAPFDAEIWATNWNVQSNGTRIRDPRATSPKTSKTGKPNLFEDPVFAYQSFRNAFPGETGERNTLRLPSFITFDMGLAKRFKMPVEGHSLQFRWEVFNLTNTQRLGVLAGGRSGYGLQIDPQLGQPAPDFGNYTGIQGTPRVMQFALRYDF